MNTIATWGSGVKGSIHLDDLPDRVSDDFEKYLKEESSDAERRAVSDEASAKDFINKVLPRKPGLQHFFPANASDKDYAALLAGGFIQGLIKDNSVAARADAEKFELSRRPGVRRQDERVTARDTRPATRSNVQKWKKAPGRSDIRGVDTARPRRVSVRVGRRGRIFTPRRTSKWVRLVVRKATKDEYFYKYRSLKTGRFIRSPEKRK